MQILCNCILFLAASVGLVAEETKKAPDFQKISAWINSEPLHIQNLNGHVVLIDFWDYSCINCIRTIPHINSWYKAYKDKGFMVIGVHTPEYSFEQELSNVQAAVKKFNILYPVALDNDYATWRKFNNKYWPTTYLVDKNGDIVFTHIGEGNYLELENAIRAQLDLPPIEAAENEPLRAKTTPEIYLGSRRDKNYTSEIKIKPDSVHAYSFKKHLEHDMVGLKGLWRVSQESVTSAGSGCSISLNFFASKVHLVLSGTSQEPITVQLDGKPLSKLYSTFDMDSDNNIFMDGDRKYDILDLKGPPARHVITVHLPAGISAYSFTFGS